MRILHVEAGRHSYGGARQVGWLIDGLAACGVDNLLVCMPAHALAGRDNARVFEWPIGGDLDFSLRRRLETLIAGEQPDVVHVHSRRGADSFGGRAARTAGIPAVLTRRVQSREPRVWLRWKCRPYAAIVAISSAVRDELLAGGIGADRIRLIPSAVDTGSFCPDPAARARLIDAFSLPTDARIAGTVAQLISRKGLELLPPLTARLLRDDPQFRLVLFGQGPERAGLEREVSRLGLAGRLLFAGFRDDWPELAPGLDLLLHPAHREGLGVAVLEAMSAGVPVVASAVGGIVDLIDDRLDGRLVAPGDAAAWHAAVSELLDRAELRQLLGEAGRRKVQSRFTIDRMADSYLRLYRELVAGVD